MRGAECDDGFDATVPGARQDPTLRKFELRGLRLPLGDSVLRLVVPDSREWRRRGSAEGDGSLRLASASWEPPYWQRIWPAAEAIARAVIRTDLSGKRVLDLGCGLGVPGIAAARRGAAVTFVDRESDALAFATWNARAARGSRSTEAQRIDWSQEVVRGQFDLVLLADVTYRTRHHAPVQQQLQACLAPGGLVVHAEPMRPEAVPFLAWLRASMVTSDGTRDVHRDGTAVQVRTCAAARDAVALGEWKPLVDALQRPRRRAQ